MISPLAEVLGYENEEVVARFSEDQAIAFSDAEEIFVETKRWLWLCARRPDAKIPLLSEARAIDEMWHTFVLFTDDYAKFCDAYFGFFVHHFPRTRADKIAWEKRIAEDNDAAITERRDTLRKAYEVICDELGAETLKTWCEDFPARFRFER
ncbi:MAG: hypothetical protein ABI461_23175 [Polyangiaceae bacterium]